MGYFEVCNHGTLFWMKSPICRLICRRRFCVPQKKRWSPGWETRIWFIQTFTISATTHDIEKQVGGEKFRLDLLHRLNTFHIHIPALRERPEDIKPLVIHFVDLYSTKYNKPKLHVSNEVFNALLKYDFPKCQGIEKYDRKGNHA